MSGKKFKIMLNILFFMKFLTPVLIWDKVLIPDELTINSFLPQILKDGNN